VISRAAVERIKVQVAALSKRHRMTARTTVAGSRLYNACQETERAFLDDRNKVHAAGLISPTADFAISGSH
jgi:hypothetical protein